MRISKPSGFEILEGIPDTSKPTFLTINIFMKSLLFTHCLALLLVLVAPSGHCSENVEEQHDVAFLENGRTETLDLYLPVGGEPETLRPAVVWIHGGGWWGGSKRGTRGISIGRDLAAAGYVVANPDYVLATEHPTWPQALLDCKNAVRFLRANAEKYRIDPDRIAVMGGSAGGHLALMVAFTEGDEGLEPEGPWTGISSRVAAVGDFYGITNLLTRQLVDKEGKPTGKLAPGSCLRFTGKSRADGADIWRFASPVTHVKPGLPPVFITHGKKDATVDYLQALELAKALEAAEVPHRMILLEKAGHSYDLRTSGGVPLELDLAAEVLEFLHEHMGDQKTVNSGVIVR